MILSPQKETFFLEFRSSGFYYVVFLNLMSMEEPKVSTPKEVVDNEDMTKKKRLEDLKKLKEKFSKGNGLLIFFIF